jgi:hypothetical protein
MFVSDRLVFLELHKTGCSHVRKILSLALDGRIVSKHNQATPDLFTEGRIFVGSVRNPWDWYVSLWGFGCDGKGALRYNLTHRLRGLGWRTAPLQATATLLTRSNNSRAWLATYRDANDPAAFRDWLHMLHDEAFSRDIGEGYGNGTMRKVAGLMTYRYLRLFSTRAGEDAGLTDLSSQSSIEAWDAERTFVDTFIHTEALEADTLRILDDQGLAPREEKRAAILAIPKTNTSSRKRAFASYYDPDTIALVAERERLIIGRFGYSAPDL